MAIRPGRAVDEDSALEEARQRHPWAAVDVVIFRVHAERLEALLVKIKRGPFRRRWAFPGGLVLLGESLDDAARRELHEKTPIHDVYLEQLFTFGAPSRNPVHHVVSTAYFALLPASASEPRPGRKYAEAAWSPVTRLPALAYDHHQIAAVALERLRAKIEYTNVAYALLPRTFTLGDLQRVYEVIAGRRFDRRNFRKKMFESGLLKRVGGFRRGRHRPASLYAFRERRVQKMLPIVKCTSPIDSPLRRLALKP
jgi:8-oxo-dGTP diphosphatase